MTEELLVTFMIKFCGARPSNIDTSESTKKCVNEVVNCCVSDDGTISKDKLNKFIERHNNATKY